MYTSRQIKDLAAISVAEYAASRNGPTIRGRNGQEHLRGTSLEEVAKNNRMTIDEADALTVDLFAATFENLSPYWQTIHLDCAEEMIKFMEQMGGESVILALNLRDDDICAHFGARLHQFWLEQPANILAHVASLHKPFPELTPDIQNRYICKLKALQQWLIAMP